SGTYSVSLTVTDDDGATDDTDSPTDAIIDPSPNNPATITITSPPSGEISGKITITAIIDGFESAVDNVLFDIYKIVDGNTQTTPSHSDSDSNAPYSISIHTKNMESGFYYDIIASANDNGEDVESDPVRVYLPAKGGSGGGPDCTAKPNHPKCQ
ncbi:MAG: hypothetical protein OEM79_06090, partial [Nitrosopumilus sp.]|nr:hypothetical protein [Nitrosopumilus sp.]